VEPLSEDGTVDLDFGEEVPVTDVKTRFALPADEESPLRKSAYGFVNVVTTEGGWGAPFLGLTTHSEPSASGDAIDLTTEVASVPDAGSIAAAYVLNVPNKLVSIEWRMGAPVDGAVIDTFLDGYTISSPTTSSAPLHTPFDLVSPDLDTGDSAGALFLTDASGAVTWTVIGLDASPGALRFPELPAGIAVADLVGTPPLRASTAVVASLDPVYGFLRFSQLPKTFTMNLD
jgi:hypothetical protein